jgi:hypothetical protein
MKLEPIIYKLKNDELCAIQITDLDTNTRLLPIKFWEQIQKQYGSFENMLQTFYNQGVTRLSVQEYRKNGSNATKKVGNSIDVSAEIQEKSPVQQQNVMMHQEPVKKQSRNVIELDYDEAIKLNVGNSSASELKIELKWKNEKIEMLEKIVEEQKTTIMENRFSEKGLDRELETKKSNNEFYLGLAQEFGPKVGEVLTGVFTKNKGVSLSQPAQPTFNLSDEKQKLFDVIKDNSFSNSYAVFIDDIIYKLHNDQQFYNDLVELITKNSIPNEN